MPKEYRTIQEVAGPLMMVKGVEGVTFDELGEIELASGEKRRCKVLEVDGDNVVVQLYENAAGINLSNSKVRFLGRTMELGVSGDMLGRCLLYTSVHTNRLQFVEFFGKFYEGGSRPFRPFHSDTKYVDVQSNAD